MDDNFIIQQTLGSNPGAFKLLVLRYERPLFRFLSAYRFPQASLEELAQETFLRAYKNLASYDPAKGAAFSTWLFVIAKNLALNELSKGRIVKFEDSTVLEAKEDHSKPIDHQLMEHEKRLVVREALYKIVEPFRSALALSYVEELSMEEIAAI